MQFIKKLIVVLLGFIALFPLAQNVNAQASQKDPVTIYLFHSESCPHCRKERAFLETLNQDELNILIKEYEVSQNRDNALFFQEVGNTLGLKVSGVPVTIIGTTVINGYGSDDSTGKAITLVSNAYQDQYRDQYVDVVSLVENDKDTSSLPSPLKINELIKNPGQTPETIHVPIFGEIAIYNLSLPIVTIVIAAVDGFNPCAMWVLLFLISLLIGMKDKKRIWILGGAFILASGFVYFLFLTAWLNLLLLLGFISWIRVLVALVAVGAGGYYLYDFITNKDAYCKVTDGDKRKKTFEKLANIATKKNLLIALIGIILLAFAVNLVEALCSAGLPAIYTQILSMNDLPIWQYYAYILLYVTVFMLDDLFIFIIAITTLTVTGIGTKYAHWARLVGGVALLLIGLAMLFKPSLIMLG